MYHPIGFKDSDNIIIIDNIPHFHYTGSTYKDKLKNGLSLEYVFQMEDIIPIIHEESSIEIEDNRSIQNSKAVDYEKNYEFYEQKEFESLLLTRKGKWTPFKKRQARNKKKKNIKLNGYAYKLFAIEQNLPEILNESEIDCENISVLSNESINYYEYDEYDYDDDDWGYD